MRHFPTLGKSNKAEECSDTQQRPSYRAELPASPRAGTIRRNWIAVRTPVSSTRPGVHQVRCCRMHEIARCLETLVGWTFHSRVAFRPLGTARRLECRESSPRRVSVWAGPMDRCLPKPRRKLCAGFSLMSVGRRRAFSPSRRLQPSGWMKIYSSVIKALFVFYNSPYTCGGRDPHPK